MSETRTCCIRCGKREPLMEVECVPYTLQLDRVQRVGSSEMRFRGAVFRHESVCACTGCAKKAVKRRAARVAIWDAVIGFVILWIAANGLWLGIQSIRKTVPAAPQGLLLAIAALGGALVGWIEFRQYSALPDAFGAAFLQEKKDKSHYHYRPCDRSLYPGKDEAERKKSFARFSALSGTDGSSLEEEIWSQHTR